MDCIRNSALFRGFDRARAEEIVRTRGRECAYAPNGCIFMPQQRIDRIGIVLRGSVQIMHIFPDGDYHLMGKLMPGYLLGADLACTKTGLSTYYAVAAEECSVLFLPTELLRPEGGLPPEERIFLLERLLTFVAQENIRKEYRLAILSRHGLRERVMVYLSMQCERHRSDTFTVPFSREELASFLCVNRSALSNTLSQMQKEGIISVKRNCFTLLKSGENRAHWENLNEKIEE